MAGNLTQNGTTRPTPADFETVTADARRINAKLKAVLVASVFPFLLMSGCSTKNYVRSQTTPLVNKTNELDDATAANNRNIQDVDKRSQAGIQQAQGAADTANQNAQNSDQSATKAQQSAQEAMNRADSLASVVADLDNYKQVADVAVTFAFGKSALTAKDKSTLDQFAGQMASAHGYILELTGGTDSIGSPQVNYDLSQRRAQAVAQYLASKYNVAPHQFYLIGIGKDEAVASNKTASGRAQNRRVQVQLLSNAAAPKALPTGSAGGR